MIVLPVNKRPFIRISFSSLYSSKGLYPVKEFPAIIGTELSGTILALPTDKAVLDDPDYKKRGYTVGAKVAVVRILLIRGLSNNQRRDFSGHFWDTLRLRFSALECRSCITDGRLNTNRRSCIDAGFDCPHVYR